MQKKHKQHYVFQAYLASWLDNKQMWCCRNNKLFQTGTQNVAQERDFYRVLPVNIDELKFISMIMKKLMPENMFEERRKFIETYLQPIEWEKQINTCEELMQKNNSEEFNTEIREELEHLKKGIDICQNNVMEDYLSEIEGQFIPWIELLKNANLDFYEHHDDGKMKAQGYYDDARFYFLYFLSIQYFRTKAMKERWITNCKPILENPILDTLGISKENIRLENLSPLFMWTFQDACAVNLRKTNAHLTLLINKTDTPFITSDQPVINLKANYSDLGSQLTELIFYYPISPNIAITVNDDNKKNKKDVLQEEVEEYNLSMVKASYQYIFGNKKEFIEKYIKSE